MSSPSHDGPRRDSRKHAHPFSAAYVACLALALLSTSACGRAPAPSPAVTTLRVCADPNNLPFSNRRGEGFENRIAELVAHDLHERIQYTWWAQRRGYLRNTINAGACDLLVGVPSGLGPVLTTQPYYRSTYVFLTRSGSGSAGAITSFDDPALRHLRIGVQLIGDDGVNTPPAHALTRRHIISNVEGYTVNSDYSKPNPPARIVEAVANGDVDLAVVWGPTAGYFSTLERVPLSVRAVSPQIDLPFLPFVFDISMGVRHADSLLAHRLDSVITRRRPQIDSILAAYRVPRVDVAEGLRQ